MRPGRLTRGASETRPKRPIQGQLKAARVGPWKSDNRPNESVSAEPEHLPCRLSGQARPTALPTRAVLSTAMRQAGRRQPPVWPSAATEAAFQPRGRRPGHAGSPAAPHPAHRHLVPAVEPPPRRRGCSARAARGNQRLHGRGVDLIEPTFPAGSATTSVTPWLGSLCGAGSGFTPTSSDTRKASSHWDRTTRSAGGAGGAPAPRSGTRRGLAGDAPRGGGGATRGAMGGGSGGSRRAAAYFLSA